MHVARRMIFRKIELGEIVIVGLDVGTFGDGKAHVGEDRRQLIGDLCDRMHAADLERRLAHRQRDVDALGVETRLQGGAFEGVAAGRQCDVDAILQPVDQRPLGLSLLRRQCAERLEQCRDRAAFAQRCDARGFERRLIARGGNVGDNFLLKLRGIGHFSFPALNPA